MSDDEAIRHGEPTRRDYIKYGSALAAGGTLAGCSGLFGADSDSDPNTSETESYTVTIEPAGEVRFDSVPETWVAENASWADMGVALGVGKPSAVVLTGEYRTWHYEDIPGLSPSKDGITSLWQDGISKERFYNIDAGVHFIDPNYLTNLIPNWEQADVDTISENVAPLCGNTSFSTYPWHDSYPYFSLYEATEKVARVFQRTARYDALQDLHDETITGIQDRLPPEDDRPEIALLSPGSTEPAQFYPYRIGDRTAYKHWRDLGVSDALAGSDIQSFTSDRGAIDYEPLLDIDPEVLVFYTDEHRTRSDFRDTYLAFMREHSTASQLTAVQNGDVYSAGGMYQGPIINLSKTERATKQLFADEFDPTEALYDRQLVADIINGEFDDE